MGFNFFKAFQGETRPLGGRYEIVRPLGAGGFGQTFLARDLHLPDHPLCVVKQLKPQVSSPAQMQIARRLFDTEAKVLYKLGSHNQIPRLLAHFEEQQDFYLAQELVEGHALSEELRPGQSWTPEQAVALLSDLLGVLAFVHQHNVIHRDIKPSNLIRRHHDGRIVLIDFGAVKQVSTQLMASNTGTHTISIGTQGYMPNEQLSGNPRFSSDIYAVGIIAIQALTGCHPTLLATDVQTCEVQWRDRCSNLPPELGDLLDHMVRYDFRTRYTSASEALAAVQTLPEALLCAAPSPVMPDAQTLGTIASDLYNSTTPWPSSIGDGERSPLPIERTGKTVALPPLPLPASPSQTKLMPIAGGMAALILAGLGLTMVLPNRAPSASPPTPTDGSDQSTNTPSTPTSSASPTQLTAETEPNAKSSEVATRLEQAEKQRVQGNYQPALNAYDQAIALDPDVPEAQWGRCYSLNKLERFSEAVEACDAAIALQPNYADALWSKGYALEQQQQPQAALDLYDQAIALDQSHAEAWNNRGTALFQLGQIEDAYTAFDRAVQINADFSEAWSNRAAALWEKGQYDAALESINRALEADPKNAIAQSLQQQMRNKLGQ
ncbi:MAG: tetratricopeptide repeat protein [Synechococcales cyanobacterium T60_A2020_003]|nr:tetratricopeptide repeat protein [Synechococcales cyanobacterium T60_A2020_003]